MFTPENELETALVAAANDPAQSPAFYRALAAADLLVIDESSPQPVEPSRGTLETGSELRIRSLEIDGQLHVPVFSSLARLRAFIRAPANFVSLGARDLFEILQGSHVVLNPGADYGKCFLPGEVQAIADGSIFSQQRSYVVPKATEVWIGQPSEYPHHIADALRRFFATRAEVRAAYLARYHDPSRDAEPCTLIGVDADGDWSAMVGEASLVLDAVARKGEVVDFVKIDDSGISRYMVEKTKPIYRRQGLEH